MVSQYEDCQSQKALKLQLRYLFQKSHPFDETITLSTQGKEKLEAWYVTHYLNDEPLGYHAPQIVRECRRCELNKVIHSNCKNPVIQQLNEWRPLPDESGKIIRCKIKNNTYYYSIIMVKYAHVIEEG